MNITHPCKQLVLDIVDELDPDAASLDAINLVVFEERRHRTQHRLDGLPRRADRGSAGRRSTASCNWAAAARVRRPRTRWFVLALRPTCSTSTDRRLNPFRPACARISLRGPSSPWHGGAPRRDQPCDRCRARDDRGDAPPSGGRVRSRASGRGGVGVDVVYRPFETELIRRAAEPGTSGARRRSHGGRSGIRQSRDHHRHAARSWPAGAALPCPHPCLVRSATERARDDRSAERSPRRWDDRARGSFNGRHPLRRYFRIRSSASRAPGR